MSSQANRDVRVVLRISAPPLQSRATVKTFRGTRDKLPATRQQLRINVTDLEICDSRLWQSDSILRASDSKHNGVDGQRRCRAPAFIFGIRREVQTDVRNGAIPRICWRQTMGGPQRSAAVFDSVSGSVVSGNGVAAEAARYPGRSSICIAARDVRFRRCHFHWRALCALQEIPPDSKRRWIDR